MATKATQERVSAEDLSKGDSVTVHVNGRAARQLGQSEFEAIIEDTSFGDIVFRPVEQLQEGYSTHTWYSDIGYIHGHHDGLDRYSDIGKVTKVTR